MSKDTYGQRADGKGLLLNDNSLTNGRGMNNDLATLNAMTDEEWTAKGIYVEDSNGDMVAATQNIEDARYIATFSPKHQRELSERMAALESVLQGIINYAFDPTETAFEPHLDKAMELMK